MRCPPPDAVARSCVPLAPPLSDVARRAGPSSFALLAHMPRVSERSGSSFEGAPGPLPSLSLTEIGAHTNLRGSERDPELCLKQGAGERRKHDGQRLNNGTMLSVRAKKQ